MFSQQFIKEIRLRRDRISSFEGYPFGLPAVRALDRLPIHPQVTIFTGENGSGKSTLLEAIAVAWGFNPEGGSLNARFSLRASESELHSYLQLVKGVRRPRDGFFLRAESLFNLATYVEELDSAPLHLYGGRSLHEQSHGEAFMAILQDRIRSESLLLFDEPEAALSPQRQLAMLIRVRQLALAGSQFVMATHSPILMAYPGALLYSFSGDGITPVAYTDTEHYRVMHDFMASPERMLAALFDDPIATDE